MTGANVARAMQLSAPTVHEMVGRLERDGYITRAADKSISFTDEGLRARRGGRPPPPADRALPDRRAEDPVGRRARGGRAARARDVAGARGAHAGRDRRREDVPARPSDRARARGSRASRSATPRSARRSPILRFENEAEDLLHLFKREGLEPGREGVVAERRRRAHHGRLRRRRPRRSRARWPRPCPCSPTRRRRRGSRCPSSSCSARSATGANRAITDRDLGCARVGARSWHALWMPSPMTPSPPRSSSPTSPCSSTSPPPGARRVASMEPILDEIAADRDDLKIVKLDVDDNQETAVQYGVLVDADLHALPQRRADPDARRRAAAQAPRVRARAGARAAAGRPVTRPPRA